MSFFKHFSLLVLLIKRDVVGRYKGSFLGLLWSFLNPLFMLVIYTFVFGVVFKGRWQASEATTHAEFALILFAGLVVFNLFAECIAKAPGLILSNVNYVKKVVFPLNILPWVSLGSAFFHWLVSVFVWIIFFLFSGYELSWTAVSLPLILLPFALLTLGLSWFLASIGVFMRDIGQVINMVITALLFLSPVFYPLSALPDSLQPYLYLNPLTFIIEQTRNVLIWGKWPNWSALAVYYFIGSVVAVLGFVWFEKTRKGFADVL